ncbi:response regulator [Cohnella endophytica]|uniref:Response regulator n=1 Tax=Cohnella endophytica TaxID=2419778 RepID=A0A494XZE4_9BACL|nr:response regulator [Cohnella endophytica]RKP54409.1 response regulator [Cohnella endophytica]
MYKIILVDDEADVREGVLREIDWTENGFQVIDVAENGREALDMVERNVPDLIVTDIRMPFMDGLQLSEHLRRVYPTVKIIILTGFDEFEYARNAIHLDIEEYVLKPFSAGDLLDSLAKVKNRLDAELAEKANVGSLHEYYRRSVPVLRELFLTSLVTRTITSAEIREKMEHYDLKLEGNYYTISVIQLDRPIMQPESGDSNRAHDRLDFELQTFAVRNIVEELASRRGKPSAYVFQHNDCVVLYEISLAADPDKFRGESMVLLEEIRSNVAKYVKCTVTIGTGALTDRLSEVKYAYADALTALDYRILIGSNRIIAIEDVESRPKSPVRFDELQAQAFLRCLKVGSYVELESISESLFAPLIAAGSTCSYRDAQIFLLQIVTTMLKVLQEKHQNTDVGWLNEILQFQCLQDAKDWVVKTCTSIMNRIESDRQSTYHALVDKAREYTKLHYADNDISIAKLCSYLHISAGYFSGIFKRETKLTYVNYLLNVRMEAAKELLLTTDLKAFEIADRVGYADPNYFSFSFKKQVGMSPKDFRSRARGEL